MHEDTGEHKHHMQGRNTMALANCFLLNMSVKKYVTVNKILLLMCTLHTWHETLGPEQELN
jgi:hypothetical protein